MKKRVKLDPPGDSPVPGLDHPDIQKLLARLGPHHATSLRSGEYFPIMGLALGPDGEWGLGAGYPPEMQAQGPAAHEAWVTEALRQQAAAGAIRGAAIVGLVDLELAGHGKDAVWVHIEHQDGVAVDCYQVYKKGWFSRVKLEPFFGVAAPEPRIFTPHPETPIAQPPTGAADEDDRFLIEQFSPNGKVYAVVEQNERCCYFVLTAERPSPFPMKPCWVRNFRPAPEDIEAEAMGRGEPSMLPRAYCRHPEGAPHFQKGELELIWAEEGDAAALKQQGKLLAVIPSWAGEKDFYGYARDCIGQSPFCWELGAPETNVQFARYERAVEFWKSWSVKPTPWEELQPALTSSLEKVFGKHDHYYAIDECKWPPKAILRLPARGPLVLATIGMCIRPQPKVECHYEDPSPHRRIELAIGLEASLPEEVIQQAATYLSSQSNLPWSAFSFLGPGHTVTADPLGGLSGGRLNCVLLTDHALGVPQVEMPRYRDDPVKLLWLIPITQQELQFSQINGSAELVRRLEHAGVGWVTSLNRKSVC
jgi:hypothetical protein